MNLEQFKALLQIYGADFGRWPPEQARAAEALRERLPEARVAWDSAERLDALFRLDRDREPATDSRRQVAIIEASLQRTRMPVESLFDWRKLCTRHVGTSLAATVLAGAITAALISPAPARRPREIPLVNALLASDVARLQDLL